MMVQRRYSSDAIVLRRRNYHEADRIVTVYSRYYGKTTLIGKGIRKIKSRKRASLENFSHIKFSASDSKFVDILTETEIINTYPNIRKKLEKVSLAYYFLEIVDKTTREMERNEEIFNLLVSYLGILEAGGVKLKKLRKDFSIEILVCLGFWPEGKASTDYDSLIEDVIEKELSSKRVGEKLFV